MASSTTTFMKSLLPGVQTHLKFYSPGASAANPYWDTQAATIKDLRGHEHEFTLNNNGFEYHTAPTKFTDFGNDAAIRSEYYREVEYYVRQFTGATHAHAVSHIERVSVKGNGKQNVQSPAPMIHGDFSYEGAWQRYDSVDNRADLDFPENWDTLKQTRWAVLSLWRPLGRVTRDALACGDKTTIPDTLLRPWQFSRATGLSHEMFTLAYDPSAQFYYRSEMDINDILLIKLFDTKSNGIARCSPHTAFQTEDDHGPARDSIETRVLVFWENEAMDGNNSKL